MHIRVLHVLNELRASGAEVMLRSAAEQWQEHGIEAHVLAVAPTVGTFAEDLSTAGYSIAHEKDDPLRRVPVRIRSCVRTGGYDVVHLHAERGNFWYALAAWSAGAAVVRTVHSVFQFSGLLRSERVAQRRLLQSLGVTHISVGPSVAANELLRFRNQTQVVDNWYDVSFEPPTPHQRAQARAAYGLGDNDLAVLSVGNCSPVKRHTAILEAMAHPNAPARLVYLHVGEEEAACSERRLATQLGISARTRFLGRRHPLQALHAADVFVMPSAHEGLPIAAVEALATGLPAVLADVPGLRDVAQVSPGALLTDTAPAPLLAAIDKAACLHGGNEAAAENVRAVQEHFGMARGVAHYAHIYRQLKRVAQVRDHTA